jgi:two-component system, cell cycle sensor histidine kinase and response regulator CckA
MPTPIRVLLVEDDPRDAELVLLELCRADFNPDWRRVDTEQDFLNHLDADLDVILCDYAVPRFNGLRALRLLNERKIDVPLILVSGTIGEELAVTAMKEGATDYLLKDRLARLGPAVNRALEQSRLRAERLKLEEQLRHSQKMEAIGQLAIGVAHDFNNILTIIQGNASVLMTGQMKPKEMTECAQQIVRASERAVGLTRQLLMFSRKQLVQPALLDLNAVVARVTTMLQRVLGEDVSIEAKLNPQVPTVKADAGMVEQILLNLAVNARDAMPSGGGLLIATDAGSLSEAEAGRIPEASAGPYARITVSDTGSGIAPEHLPRIFEPFFTTKDVGKGTGLGLATVYGIVKQHHGWITVSSELNKGTSFAIYFPVTPETASQNSSVPASS